MLDAETIYNPGSVLTRANIGKAGSPLDDMLQRLLMQKLLGGQRQKSAPRYFPSATGPSEEEIGRNRMSRLQEKMMRLDLQDKENRLAAAANPPGLKMGWLGPEYANPMQFNAYQKELYLPDQGTFTITPEDESRARGDLEKDLQGEQDRRENWDEHSFAGSGGQVSALKQRIAELEAALGGKG